jgi:hypothetical protein
LDAAAGPTASTATIPHGGSVSATSAGTGNGSRLVVSLPVLGADRPPAGPVPVAAGA